MSQQTKITNGKIGEVLVELELLKLGWHVERLDGAAKAVNGDLIAIKGRKRIVIQVKSALSWSRPSFGHASGWLLKRKPFFNAGGPTVMADVLVTVCGSADKPHFHVFEIGHAERLARKAAIRWHRTPTKGGRRRSANFPLSFHLTDPEMQKAEDKWELVERVARK
jgi:hypothetical protein